MSWPDDQILVSLYQQETFPEGIRSTSKGISTPPMGSKVCKTLFSANKSQETV